MKTDKDSDAPDMLSREPGNPTEPPTVSFDVVSEMFRIQDGVEKLFQLLTVQGQLTIQV